MKVLVVGSLMFLGAACNVPNPLSCADGNCTDPGHPFCDVDGSLSGSPKTCVAIDCTPNAFYECRGDHALVCNTGGNNYDDTTCPKGCDPSAGCRVCDANTTVCTNGVTQTCDANGHITASESCVLGCFETEPRCRDLDPSNNLAQYLDQVSAPPDLTLTNGTIYTTTGRIFQGPSQIDVPTFLIPAGSNGVAIRVFVVNKATFNNVVVSNDGSGASTALAIVANDEVDVMGTLDARSAGMLFGPGACVGGLGYVVDDLGIRPGSVQSLNKESGGGGNATVGGKGGAVLSLGQAGDSPSASGGAIIGTKALVPLQGGCPGGGETGASFGDDLTGSYGGGAIQISSRVAVKVDGTIDVSGSTSNYTGEGGGGAGGGILLEAPKVVLGPSAALQAGGGHGAGCATVSTYCAAGGTGATVDAPAGDGMTISYTSSSSVTYFASGGGGGGLGRIRINTPDMTYSRSSSTVENGDLSVGTLSTR